MFTYSPSAAPADTTNDNVHPPTGMEPPDANVTLLAPEVAVTVLPETVVQLPARAGVVCTVMPVGNGSTRFDVSQIGTKFGLPTVSSTVAVPVAPDW